MPPPTLAAGPTLTGPPRGTSPGAFAPSPLTELANGIRDIALAALDGRPLPSGAIPVQPSRDPERRVRSDGPAPKSSDLDVLVFAMEMTLVLRAPRDSGGDDDGRGAIEIIAFLSRTGLKVASLRTRDARSYHPLPDWLSGVGRGGGEIFSALKSRRIGDLLVGQTERPVLGDDLYQMLMEKRPTVERLQEAEALAAAHDRVLGYHLDDVFLVARDRDGTVWGLELEIDESDGKHYLDGSPLVRIERVKRDRSPPPEAPPPPPAP